MSFTVVIIGRPNVGKSTLFNRLVGKRLALVDDRPGVTRDRREGHAWLIGLEFDVIDTAGLEEAFDNSLEGRMRAQTERAVADADVALLLIDARAGVTPLDEHFARWLRKGKTPVVLVANKCEGRGGQSGLIDCYSLGLGEPIPVSAEHGEGMGDLFDALLPFAPPEEPKEDEDEWPAEEEAAGDDGEEVDPAFHEQPEPRELHLAIVGRPNVGKSTLINRLVGEDRLLTGPEAGITRDSISVSWVHDGKPMRLIDTAGMRRRANITDKLEKLSVADTLHSIRFAHVVVLVVEPGAILDKQDLTIARMVENEGRALVIAINKWDMAEDRGAAIQRLRDRLEAALPQIRGVSFVALSALTGAGLNRLLPVVLKTYEVWNRRVSTGLLNRWLGHVTDNHPPPIISGRRQRLRYMTQAKARPPTFIIFASKPDELPETYMRYLVGSMRQEFDLPGVPIRLRLRKGKNPYVND